MQFLQNYENPMYKTKEILYNYHRPNGQNNSNSRRFYYDLVQQAVKTRSVNTSAHPRS